MNCKDMTKDKLDQIITKYGLFELSDDEQEEFEQHLEDCEGCRERTLAGLKVQRLLQERLTYDDLREAFDEKDWARVIELGKELDKLGAPEEVYPREERITESKLMQQFIKVGWEDVGLKVIKPRLKSDSEFLDTIRRIMRRKDISEKLLISKNINVINATLNSILKKYNVQSVDELRKILKIKK